MKRKSRTITDQEFINFLIKATPDDLCDKSFFMETFGEFGNKRRYYPYDLITIPAGAYGPEGKKNKKPFVTTIGIFIFNKVFIEPHVFDLYGYINKPITKKLNGKINSDMSYAVLENRLSLEDLKEYHMKEQKFMPYANIISPSFSKEMLLGASTITKKKKELINKYKKELDAGDIVVASKIEKELLDYSKEILKDDPAMDMYTSGAKGSFNNNFKNLFVMQGAAKDPDPSKGYNIVKSSLVDGISREDYSNVARGLAAGPYARGKRTMVGGYWEKLFFRALQHLTLDPNNKDCHTKRTIELVLTEKYAKLLMYSYMVEGNRLVELTSQNVDKYIGKKVKFRFSSLCESEKGICQTCAGNFFNRLGIRNVGVATPQVASKLKVISMKAFHDAQVHLHRIDVGKAFFPDGE